MKQAWKVGGMAVLISVLGVYLALSTVAHAENKRGVNIQKPVQTIKSAPVGSSSNLRYEPVGPKQRVFSKKLAFVEGMQAFSGVSPELKLLVASFLTMFQSESITASDIVRLPSYQRFLQYIDPRGLVEVKSIFSRIRSSDIKSALVMLLSAVSVNKSVGLEVRSKIIKVLREISLSPYRPQDTYQLLALASLSQHMDESAFRTFTKQFYRYHEQGSQQAVQNYIYEGTLQEMSQESSSTKALKPKKKMPSLRAK